MPLGIVMYALNTHHVTHAIATWQTHAIATSQKSSNACIEDCFGETCDFWVENWKTPCTEIEKMYGCDCSACQCGVPDGMLVARHAYGNRRTGTGTGSGSGTSPTPAPSGSPTQAPSDAPTSAPTGAPTDAYQLGLVISAGVKLTGVTSAQFSDSAEDAFEVWQIMLHYSTHDSQRC